MRLQLGWNVSRIVGAHARERRHHDSVRQKKITRAYGPQKGLIVAFFIILPLKKNC